MQLYIELKVKVSKLSDAYKSKMFLKQTYPFNVSNFELYLVERQIFDLIDVCRRSLAQSFKF